MVPYSSDHQIRPWDVLHCQDSFTSIKEFSSRMAENRMSRSIQSFGRLTIFFSSLCLDALCFFFLFRVVSFLTCCWKFYIYMWPYSQFSDHFLTFLLTFMKYGIFHLHQWSRICKEYSIWGTLHININYIQLSLNFYTFS